MGLAEEYAERLAKDVPFGKLAPFHREPVPEPEEISDAPEWAQNPTIYVLNGKEVEFYQIGSLGKALGRANVTIRWWEKEGKLPLSPFRSPKPIRSTVHGSPQGRRLWTRSQIDGILRIAREEGCIVDADQSPPTKRFTQRVTNLFNEIHKQTTRTGN